MIEQERLREEESDAPEIIVIVKRDEDADDTKTIQDAFNQVWGYTH